MESIDLTFELNLALVHWNLEISLNYLKIKINVGLTRNIVFQSMTF